SPLHEIQKTRATEGHLRRCPEAETELGLSWARGLSSNAAVATRPSRACGNLISAWPGGIRRLQVSFSVSSIPSGPDGNDDRHHTRTTARRRGNVPDSNRIVLCGLTLVRETGVEPVSHGLRDRCSTNELLHRHTFPKLPRNAERHTACA